MDDAGSSPAEEKRGDSFSWVPNQRGARYKSHINTNDVLNHHCSEVKAGSVLEHEKNPDTVGIATSALLIGLSCVPRLKPLGHRDVFILVVV
jgi:short subunit dehydrogenase-like uncharacterized protein